MEKKCSEGRAIGRRQFLAGSAVALGGLALDGGFLQAASVPTLPAKGDRKGAFTMWQIPSFKNTIGNTYVFRTCGGKVIVMDGGFEDEALTLRGFIAALGNEVEAWFISHPHEDHMGALSEIVKDPWHMRIKNIYHSRISEAVRLAEQGSADNCKRYYEIVDNAKDINVVDVRRPGDEFDFDGMHLKILSVANDEMLTNPYNNSSMIMRVWDKQRSIVFLGDAGAECGNKALRGPYASYLNCDYLQMAHHGQNGCTKEFYNSVKFRVCLWPTPSWVWEPSNPAIKTHETRAWMDELGIKEHHVSCLEGVWRLG